MLRNRNRKEELRKWRKPSNKYLDRMLDGKRQRLKGKIKEREGEKRERDAEATSLFAFFQLNNQSNLEPVF